MKQNTEKLYDLSSKLTRHNALRRAVVKRFPRFPGKLPISAIFTFKTSGFLKTFVEAFAVRSAANPLVTAFCSHFFLLLRYIRRYHLPIKIIGSLLQYSVSIYTLLGIQLSALRNYSLSSNLSSLKEKKKKKN